jgi:hypothetical protein
MRWRSVAIAGVLGPLAAGCNIAHNAARNLINEPHVVWTGHAIEHDLRKLAKEAWEMARGECPEHADSAAFRDGFIDGYVDYLDRGGNGSLPATPPAKYTRHKDYFTENGQCLVKEYFLGFKMGQERAIASGQRQLLTVPVLVPQQPSGPPAFNVQPIGSEPPPAMIPPRPPVGVEPTAARVKDVPGVAAPRVLATPPLHQSPLARLAAKTAPPGNYEPEAKPLPAVEPVGTAVLMPEFHPIATDEPLPLPAQPGPSGPDAWGDLPAIPAPPASAQPPKIAAPKEGPALRVLPPNHTVRPPLPPNHPQPRQ